LLILLGVVVIAVLVGIAFLFYRGFRSLPPKPTAAAAAPESATVTVATAAAPVQPPTPQPAAQPAAPAATGAAPAVAETAPAAATNGATATPVPPPTPAAPAPVPAIPPALPVQAPASATNPPPTVAKAPAEETVVWPSLTVSGLMGGKQAGQQGAAIINGQMLGVGESIEGVRIIEVSKQGVRLRWQNQTRLVKVGESTD
jgi:hypothetical protein